MNIPSMMNSKKGFIGLGMLILSLVIIIMASAVLYNSFYNLFETGKNEENISRDYASLSSGIYYGAWCVKNKPAGTFYITINSVDVTVKTTSGVNWTIVASRTNPAKTMTATCSSSGVITAWD